MEITRNVVKDLLPLYVANEVSTETRELVTEYLKRDPELASAAKDLSITAITGSVPPAMTSEHQLQAFREAKRMMLYKNILWAAVVSFGLLIGLALALLAARSVGVLSF